MSFRIAVPNSVLGGWSKDFGRLRLGFLYHSLQCDQRWLFLVRWRRSALKNDLRFGYRTRGDATPNIMTYHDGGWHWPWKFRFTSGRG
jgi:hypothetical protein